MEKLDPKCIENILTLTPLQEGMLFHYLKDSRNDLHFEQLNLEISGSIDVDLFEKAWNVVIQSNEMLRTVFRWEKVEKPSQIILKEHACEIRFHDFSYISDDQQKMALAKIKVDDRDHGFDLTHIPFRVILCKLTEIQYEMIISNHHIIYDGWSNGIIIKEFFKAYYKLTNGENERKLPDKTSFKEFVRWLQRLDKKRGEQYWREYLAGFETATELPIKRKKEKITGVSDYSITLGKDIQIKLNIFSKNNRVTLASIFYTAWGILLQKYCSSEDVIFGTTVSGRTAGIKGIEDMVGLFINTVPMRIDTSPGETIVEAIYQVDHVLHKREEFELTPLIDIQNYSSLGSSGSLFDTILVFENYPLDNYLVPEDSQLSIHSYSMMETTHYDLTISITPFDEIEIKFSFKKELFDKVAIENLAVHFKIIIQKIIEQPKTFLSEFEIISTAEKNRILYEFNNTAAEYPRDKTIHQLFEEQVSRSPDHIAVFGHGHASTTRTNTDNNNYVGANPRVCPSRDVHCNVSLTYHQLNEQSNRLAELLSTKGVLPDNIVGIMIERSIDLIIGIMGILKSGGAYLPINPDYPEERINYMLKDSNVRIMIGSAEEWKSGKAEKDFLASNSSNLAYVIYTSGSTGQPKGVPITHANLSPLLHWGYQLLRITTQDRTVQNLSYFFDWSVWEIFITLTSGAGLCMVSGDVILDAGCYLDFIYRHAINVLHITPTHFQSLLHVSPGNRLHTLRYLCIGAEKLSYELVEQSYPWLSKNCRIFNMYGPTEVTIMSAVFEISKSELTLYKKLSSVPIGKNLGNNSLFILDRYMHPSPISVPGELYIGGAGVARGYLNNPELTKQKFILPSATRNLFEKRFLDFPKLLINHYPPFTIHHSPIYCTGDFVRWLPDSNIEFLGRIDHQVKIRGFRIELSEIENFLLRHESIKEAVVVVNEDGGKDKILIAYFVSSLEILETKLRQYLLEELPDYMIPSYFVRLEKIPLTPNGKLDRKTLPKPGSKAGENYIPPRNEMEKILVEMWSDILGRDELHTRELKTSIGIDDNFFRLGGHSLKATILASRIEKNFNVKISLAEIFKNPRIKEIAKYIKTAAVFDHKEIHLAEQKEYYALSSAQKRLYFLQQLDKTGIAYNISAAWLIKGIIEKSRLEKAFIKLIRRHESLRTSFVVINEEPVQRIHDEVEFEIEYLATDMLPQYRQTRTFLINFIRTFDLSRAPLLRVALQKEKEDRHILMFDMHHIISDGFSMNILIKDFIAFYRDEELPEFLFQYKDFAIWQNHEKEKKSIKKQENYWLEEFTGEIPVLELPFDYPRPPFQSFEGSTIHFEVEQATTAALNNLALVTDITMYMILLAVYTVFLAKITNQEDIVVGSPIVGRRHPDLEKIIGMFVNTLALRNYPSGEKTFTAFLYEVREKTLSAFENQDYQFEDLVEHVVTNRNTSRNPVFDVMLVFQNMEMPEIELPGLVFKLYDYENKTAKFDLNLTGLEKDGKLIFCLEYSTKLFKEETALRLISYFKNLINIICKNPEARIFAIQIMGKEEKEQILAMSNGITEPIDFNETIHGMFEKIAIENEDKIAVVFKYARMTYKELNCKANLSAQILQHIGIRRDSIVGLMVERSFELIIGMIGIMKAGGAYLLIDPNYPRERIDYMIKDSNAQILINKSEIRNPKFETNSNDQKTNDQNKNVEDSMVLNFENLNFEFVSCFDIRASNFNSSNLAYVIYTSGSTGRPKGVMLEHINLVNLIKFHHHYTGIDCSKVLQFATISFDASFHEIFSALLAAGELYLIDEETRNNIAILLKYISKNKIKTLFLPMAFLKIIFNDDEYLNIFPSSVEHIQTAGEQVIISEKFKDYLKTHNINLHNHYGPSETHVITTFTVNPQEDIPEFPPIGKPIQNTRIYILDKAQQLLPIGVAGELYAEGLQVGRGYLNNPGITADKFNRSYTIYKTSILYRTGDLCKWLLDGNIEFLGRIDQQVKIRGIRIEPGEIESQLKKIETIKDAIVVVKQYAGREKYLCAYIVFNSCTNYNNSELRNRLSNHLPDYMIPSYFVQMDKIPLSQSGKIDKKALPEPELKNNENYVAPRNEIEKKLVELWSEVLAKDTLLSPQLQTSIGIDDNFFQLGGHSLKAINIINKIQKSFGVTIELQTIFQHPTIAGISRIIRNSKVTGFEDIEKQPEKEYYDLSYSQKRLWYISKTEPDSPLFNMSGIVKLDETINEQVIRIVLGQLAARHESLRTCFKEKDKEPRQVIEPVDRLKINLEIMDISELSGPDKEKRRKEILMAESLYIFNLEQLPLFRVKLIKYAADEYNLVFNMHHIISDGWSIEILKQEFRQLVDAYKKGIEAPLEFLEPLGIQYKDYAVWQNRLLADEKQVGKAQEFWREQLSGGLPKLNLPYDFSTNYSADDKESAGYRWVIPGDLSGRLKLIAESRQASLFMLLLAGFNILMAQVSGQEKIIIAIPAAARQHEYLKNIIGLFLNTLILSSRVVGSEPFQVFFNRLQNNIFKVLEYQGIPLESICGQLKIKYPEVSVLFNMINTGTTEQQNLDNLASYHIEKIQDAKFEIVCYLTEYKNGIEINCHYYKNRFNPNIIEKLMERYLEILAHISDNPSRNIREYFFSGKQKKLKRGGDPCTLKIEKK